MAAELEKVKFTAEEVQTKVEDTVRGVIRAARLGWMVIQGVHRAAGIGISMTSRLVVSAGFGAIQTLYPLLMAALHLGEATFNVPTIVASLIGLTQLTTAMMALAAYESDQKEISKQLRGLNFVMSSIGLMIR